jgi:integrase/recombinase XerD
MGTALVLYQGPGDLDAKGGGLPEIIRLAGQSAVDAAEDFFDGAISNDNTRRAYRHAVNGFLHWGAREHRLQLPEIAPRHWITAYPYIILPRSYFRTLLASAWAIRRFASSCRRYHPRTSRSAALDVFCPSQYRAVLAARKTSIATRKQHLSALRHFFDAMVTSHLIFMNPALPVRGERYEVVEGKTPEITAEQPRTLLAAIDTSAVIGLRDRVLLAILIYTAVRVGAAAALLRGDFYDAGDQWLLHFDEKGGRSREIPVRHDLQKMIFAYIEAAGLREAPDDAPLFRSAVKNNRELSKRPFHVNDACRMMKRRLRRVQLPERLSPHSFRVATITDLLRQNVPLEDVQRLAGHADPRTTRLYDRRDRTITRNIVERISI